jgi:hypothetical protein
MVYKMKSNKVWELSYQKKALDRINMLTYLTNYGILDYILKQL